MGTGTRGLVSLMVYSVKIAGQKICRGKKSLSRFFPNIFWRPMIWSKIPPGPPFGSFLAADHEKKVGGCGRPSVALTGKDSKNERISIANLSFYFLTNWKNSSSKKSWIGIFEFQISKISDFRFQKYYCWNVTFFIFFVFQKLWKKLNFNSNIFEIWNLKILKSQIWKFRSNFFLKTNFSNRSKNKWPAGDGDTFIFRVLSGQSNWGRSYGPTMELQKRTEILGKCWIFDWYGSQLRDRSHMALSMYSVIGFSGIGWQM